MNSLPLSLGGAAAAPAAPPADAADTARANITSNRFLAAEIFIVPGKEFKNKA